MGTSEGMRGKLGCCAGEEGWFERGWCGVVRWRVFAGGRVLGSLLEFYPGDRGIDR